MLVQVVPLVLACHCTVGAGLPLAAAVKTAVCPALTVNGTGCVVTAGGVFTVNVAALDDALPRLLVNTARNCFPLSAEVVVKEYEVVVAPEISFQVLPLSVLTCHFVVGVGDPLAAAVNVTC